jgi:hypothetical protein
MQFSVGRPDMVRAINQRWLLKFWQRSRAGAPLPSWQAVEAEDLSRIAANLSYLSVNGSEDARRFQIFSHGETIGRVYGSVDCRGKYLDEIVPPARYTHAAAPYAALLKSSSPVYTIHDVTDKDGRLIHYERLLLPFSNDSAGVDRILASFEFICADGAFDSIQLMMTQTGPPVMRLSAIIEARVSA